MTQDFYDLLDVPPDSSREEIRRAFREKVREYHPDHNDDERARAQFTVLKKAYDVLADPIERRAYDRLGHESYVAKRTSGIPSPESWRTDRTESVDGASRTTAEAAGAGAAASGAGTTASGTGTASHTGSVGSAAGPSAGGGADRGAAGGSGGSNANRRAAGRGGVNRTVGAWASRRRASGKSSPFADSAFVRWWRSRNVAWPLLWLATMTYVLGLAQYASRNADGLRSIAAGLAASGADLAAAWTALAANERDVDTAYGHVSSAELVSPPVEPSLWYALLGTAVALVLLVLLVARLRWRDGVRGPVSIDETIVVGLALGTATVLIGGPLLAGAVLLPLLFGVVVRRTRQLPGWSPSYAYVLAVSFPAAALAAGALGYESLPFELAAIVLLPLAGSLGLPLRVGIRRRFGI